MLPVALLFVFTGKTIRGRIVMKIITKRVKSKFRQCLYPYEKYHSAGPFRNKEGRLRINLIRSSENFFGMLYSTYIYEVYNERKTKTGFSIDHIDGDKTNDVLENLQEITSKENRVKGTSNIIKSNCKNKKRIFLWCPVCHKRFKILRWKVNLKKLKQGKKFYFCCRECAWKAQFKSFKFPDKQKYKKIKQKPFEHKNQCEDFKKFSKPIFIEKKVRICDCGNELPTPDSKYCCKKCRIKYSRYYKVKKNKLLKYCKRSLKKFGRYNYSWIGRKSGVSNNAIKKNIVKYKL